MIELLIAMSVLSVGILATYAMFQSGLVQIKRASNVTTATAIADSELEAYRAIKYASIGLDDADVLAADSTYKSDSAYRGQQSGSDPSTTLSGGVTAAATTLTVASSSAFPSQAPFRILVDSEYMFVTAGAGTTTWTVVRGASSSTAAAHSSGAAVTLFTRVDLDRCGSSPCTDSVPTKTVAGADGKSYRLDTYMTWSVVTNASGTPGRGVKVITLVVRDGTTNRVYARVSSSFDESTGL